MADPHPTGRGRWAIVLVAAFASGVSTNCRPDPPQGGCDEIWELDITLEPLVDQPDTPHRLIITEQPTGSTIVCDAVVLNAPERVQQNLCTFDGDPVQTSFDTETAWLELRIRDRYVVADMRPFTYEVWRDEERLYVEDVTLIGFHGACP